ncbi:MAG: glycosyltransferase [Patescibacteria group bacterium]
MKHALVTLFDNSYVIAAAAMLKSFARNSKAGERPAIYLLLDSVTQENLTHLVTILTKHSLEYVVVDMNEWLNAMPHIPTRGHVSRTAYFKAFIPDILPGTFHTALYIDPDVIFLRNIKQLYRYDISSNPLGAVVDPYLPKDGLEVFNSGVMLLNLSYLRKIGLAEAFFNVALQNKETIKERNDQPVFNILFSKSFLELPLTYNYIVHDLRERKKFLWRPHIVHFAGSKKPWHVVSTHRYRRAFRFYLRGTVWEGASSDPVDWQYRYEAYIPWSFRKWFDRWEVWQGKPFTERTFRMYRKYYIEKFVPYFVRIRYENAKAKVRKLMK